MRWSILVRAAILVAASSSLAQTIRWPAVSEELWTTYGEYQYYPRLTPTPYLHTGLDIAAPPYSRVFSIAKGRVTGMRWDDKIITRPDGIDTSVEVKEPGEASVIVQDLGAANEPLGEGWFYGHIDVGLVQDLARRRNPYGWTRDPGDVLTIIHPEANHLHVERMRPSGQTWTEWSPDIEDPLRVFKDAGVVVTADPIAPSLGALYSCVKFDFDESSPCYPNQVLPMVNCGCDIPEWESPLIQIAFGKVDIVARVDDWFGQPGQPGDDRSLGVAAIGYEIRRPWLGSLTVVGPYTREFRGEIQNAQGKNISNLPAGMAAATYRQTAHFESTNENALYSVTNYHNQMPDNWSAEAQAACWNTRMRQNGGLPWEAEDATQDADPEKPGYPEFHDGLYQAVVTAADLFNTTSHSVPVIVDNFAPYLREIMVCRPQGGRERNGNELAAGGCAEGVDRGGTPEERDCEWILLHGRWELNDDEELEWRELAREASPDADVFVELTFSEDMDTTAAPWVRLQRSDERRGEGKGWPDSTEFWGTTLEGTTYRVAGAWQSGQVWRSTYVSPDPLDPLPPDEAPAGDYVVGVVAHDMAGNALTLHPERFVNRTETGEWSDPEYDPDGAAVEERCAVTVAPALWAVVDDGSQRGVRGFGHDGKPERDVAAAIEGLVPVSCSGDPVDGGCWIVGTCEGTACLAKVDAGGEPCGAVYGLGGYPVWVGADHHDGGVWTVSEDGGSNLVVRKHRGDGTTQAGRVAEGVGSLLCASVDQAMGRLWVAAWGWPDVELHAFRGDTIESSGEFIVVHEGSGELGESMSLEWVGISAIPGSGSVWVAGTWVASCGMGTDLLVQRWGTGGAIGEPSAVEAGGDAGEGTCESHARSFTGVATDPVTNTGVWVWMTAKEVVERGGRPVPGSSYEAEDLLGAAGGGDPGHGITMAGCTTACGDEYVDSRLLSASPRLGGVWWVRPRSVPGGGSTCETASGRFYRATFHQVTGAGEAEALFSRDYANVECPDPYGEGILQISACAGGKWEWPEEAARPVAQKDGAVNADASSGEPRVYEYRLSSVGPNPCNGCPGVTVRYSLAGNAAPRFDLYNLAGQAVRTVMPGVNPAGEYTTSWDVRDFAGKRVPAATYILQMRTEEYVARTPVVVIR